MECARRFDWSFERFGSSGGVHVKTIKKMAGPSIPNYPLQPNTSPSSWDLMTGQRYRSSSSKASRGRASDQLPRSRLPPVKTAEARGLHVVGVDRIVVAIAIRADGLSQVRCSVRHGNKSRSPVRTIQYSCVGSQSVSTRGNESVCDGEGPKATRRRMQEPSAPKGVMMKTDLVTGNVFESEVEASGGFDPVMAGHCAGFGRPAGGESESAMNRCRAPVWSVCGVGQACRVGANSLSGGDVERFAFSLLSRTSDLLTSPGIENASSSLCC